MMKFTRPIAHYKTDRQRIAMVRRLGSIQRCAPLPELALPMHRFGDLLDGACA
jgi:hypothetical protein